MTVTELLADPKWWEILDSSTGRKLTEAERITLADAMPPEWRDTALVEMELTGEIIPLRETAMDLSEAAGGLAKIIDPGWGTSGYYPAAVLERDGPNVFKAGMKMYWNHPTAAEEASRPEGDLNKVAAKLKEDARWLPSGPKGPGLYAPITVYEKFKGVVKEMAPDIGLSIRAGGMGRQGTIEGRTGPIVEQLKSGRSVDFVTQAGRGGEVIEMFEAAGRQAPPANPKTGGDMAVTEAEFNALKESISQANAKAAANETENRGLKVRLALAEGKEYATGILAGITMPDATRAVLLSRLVPLAPVSEVGVLDQVAFKTLITAEATKEIEYISKLTGSGRVNGMGSPPPASDEAAKAALAESKNRTLAAYRSLGLSESQAKIAAGVN